jgi:cell division protein FtsB
MPIVLLALMIVIPVLLIFGRFILGAAWIVLKVIALTVKSEIEDYKARRMQRATRPQQQVRKRP